MSAEKEQPKPESVDDLEPREESDEVKGSFADGGAAGHGSITVHGTTIKGQGAAGYEHR